MAGVGKLLVRLRIMGAAAERGGGVTREWIAATSDGLVAALHELEELRATRPARGDATAAEFLKLAPVGRAAALAGRIGLSRRTAYRRLAQAKVCHPMAQAGCSTANAED